VSAAAFAAAEDKTEIAAVKRVIREENRRALAQTIRDPGTYVGAIPLALALGYIGYAAVARENIYRGKPYDNWVAKVNAAATGAVAGAAVSVVPPLLSMSGEGGALWGVLVLAAAGTCGWWMSTRSEMFHNDAFLYYGTSVLLTMPLWIWYL
ncbi:MAG: hypothetical protein FWB94_11835, partial [Chitinispirillia bacterium]|nr:hypothetical protein [Chitinispirillia bacterium]